MAECCPTMEKFVAAEDSHCVPRLSDGYIAGCDASFRYRMDGSDEEYDDDERKQIKFCPWCGKERA